MGPVRAEGGGNRCSTVEAGGAGGWLGESRGRQCLMEDIRGESGRTDKAFEMDH